MASKKVLGNLDPFLVERGDGSEVRRGLVYRFAHAKAVAIGKKCALYTPAIPNKKLPCPPTINSHASSRQDTAT